MPLSRDRILKLIEAAGLSPDEQEAWTRVRAGKAPLVDSARWVSFMNGRVVEEVHLRGFPRAPSPFVPMSPAQAKAKRFGRVRFILQPAHHKDADVEAAVELVLRAMTTHEPFDDPPWCVSQLP